MSADLNKTMLGSKDKDELTQIAQAMGGKPTSRARKADIIDMILDLAGGGDDGPEPKAGADAPPARAATAYSADPMADARAAEARERNGGSGGSGRSRAEDGRSGRGDEAGRNDGRNGGAGNGGKSSNRGNGDDSSRGAGQSGGDAGNAADGRSRGDDSGPDAGGDQGGDGPEPGNRRRRRRGRNRERADQGEEFTGDPVPVRGVLDLRDDGYGFLRVNGYLPTRDDVYVSVKQVRQHGLRKGDQLTGTGRPANRSEKNPAMVQIDTVNGRDPESGLDRPHFDELTAIIPDERISLEREDDPDNHTARIIDLLSPIGKGQRGLVVSQPGAGRTTILKDVARSIETNHPDVALVVVLIDERPEEVTEMRRLILNGEVVSSTFDQVADEHAAVADLAIERAKRMVEMGDDVFIIFDGVTRLARAANLAAAGNGQVSVGGIAASALSPAKRFFGSARNLEEGGSLTILASAHVDTGSPIDELIFDEFSGSANMQMKLDRTAATRRIYPAIDVEASTTRNEEHLFEEDELDQVAMLRRRLSAAIAEGGPTAGLEQLISLLSETDTNTDLLKKVAT